MSETPNPSKGQPKRRGLALPPRGQALARLQDLEQEHDLEQFSGTETALQGKESKAPPFTASSNAVNTASSNAVIDEGNDAVPTESLAEPDTVQPIPVASTNTPSTNTPPSPPAHDPPASVAVSGTGHHLSARAAREPTTRITVDMPDSLHQKISVLSAQTRRSIKDLVIEALAATYFGTEADLQ